MIPTAQTRVGSQGNCFSACLSSILEIPLWEIPNFSTDDDLFLGEVQEFLATHGMYYVQVPIDEPTIQAAFANKSIDLWHLIEGISPRGGEHACVGLNGELYFDPHPPHTGGLVSTDRFGLLCARMDRKKKV